MQADPWRESEPSEELAAAIAAKVIGRAPETVARFATGARHYVYDATFAKLPPVVVRIGDRAAHAEMAGAVYLSNLLRPRGVPLPAIFAEDVRSVFPWMVLERLPGADLCDVIERLTDAELERIAVSVIHAQSITAEIASAGRYGYAVRPDEAPYSAWSEALRAHLGRSQRRIAAAGLFDVAITDGVESDLSAMRDEVDAVSPTPFLHDTTTRNVIVTAEGAFSGIVDVDDL